METVRFRFFGNGARKSKPARASRRILAAERLEERSLLAVMPLAWPAAGPQLAAEVSIANGDQLVAPSAVLSPTAVINTVAGNGQKGLSGDRGPAVKAKLNQPLGIAVDAAGDIFIADSWNDRVREVSHKTGKISTVRFPGAVRGFPMGLAVNRAGTVLYVAENQNEVIHKVDLTTSPPKMTKYAGTGNDEGSDDDGVPANQARLSLPTDVELDKNGDLYIVNGSNRIRKVDHTTQIITTVLDGITTTPWMNNITSVAVDDNLNLYFNSGSQIYKAAPGGTNVQLIGSTGSVTTTAQGIAVSPNGDTVYFGDSGNQKILAFHGGAVTTVVGTGTKGFGGDGGPPGQASLNNPNGVALDAAGNLYIADSFNHRIRAVKTPRPIVPTKLVFSPMPAGIVAGVAFPSSVVVTAKDARGRIATDFNGVVTLTVADTQTLNLLGGETSVTAVRGVATFSGLTLTNGTPKDRMWSTPYDHLVATAELQATGAAIRGKSAGFGVLGYTPAQIRKAYGFDEAPLDADGKPHYDGRGQTIAIVNPYFHPTIFSDLDAFDKQFGLTSTGPTLFEQYGDARSFLTVVNSAGHLTPLPKSDPGTGSEIAMDVQWAHAIAPGAKIVLIESASGWLKDLMAGVATAVNPPADAPAELRGVSVVSMSFGLPEGPNRKTEIDENTERLWDATFITPANHQGVTFLAATGDDGAPGGYPAYSPNVVAVGGTTMYVQTDNTYDQGGWKRSGGGQSRWELAPPYQAGVQTTGKRTIPDVAFLADPKTTVAVHNSYKKPRPGADKWEAGGGTSLGAPVWAGLFAMVNQGRVERGKSTLNTAAASNPSQPVPTEALAALYSLPAGDFHKDIDSWNNNGVPVNGTSNSGLTDKANYNEVVGLGTPRANFLIPDLISYVSPSAHSHNNNASNPSVFPGPETPTATIVALVQVDSTSPSASVNFIDRSPVPAIWPSDGRFSGSGPAAVPLPETVGQATPKTTPVPRKPRSRAASGLFDAALAGTEFGAGYRFGAGLLTPPEARPWSEFRGRDLILDV